MEMDRRSPWEPRRIPRRRAMAFGRCQRRLALENWARVPRDAGAVICLVKKMFFDASCQRIGTHWFGEKWKAPDFASSSRGFDG